MMTRKQLASRRSSHTSIMSYMEEVDGLDEVVLPPMNFFSLLASAALSSWGKRLLWLCLYLMYILFTPILLFSRLFHSHGKVPPPSNELLLKSATELARMIKSQEVTSEKVVQVYIDRIKEVNPLLNAVVDERFSEALQEARGIDRLLRRKVTSLLERDKPFLGVPVSVKESIAVKGLSHGAGQLEMLSLCASEDAEVVKQLRAAGAVPLLVSNCPELCMHYESRNRVTGVTNNPYDYRRTPAGSSGGEAALLGAAASVIGIGSDIGGSSRLPAMFSGVFGHKPTAGLVCNEGHLPTSDDEDWWRFFTIAPMARYAIDLLPLLKVMVQSNELHRLRLDDAVELKEIRVYYMQNDGGSVTSDRVHPDIVTCLLSAVEHLYSVSDYHPLEVCIRDLKYALDLTALCIFRLEGVNSVFQADENDPKQWKSVRKEWIKYFIGSSNASFYSLLYGPLKKLFENYPDDELEQYIDKLTDIKSQFQDMLGENGVFLYPTFVEPAVFHNEMYFKFLNCMYCSIFNVLGLPATNCPIGISRNGMPIGIQIIAAPYQDRLCLAIAQELETAFGGWHPPD